MEKRAFWLFLRSMFLQCEPRLLKLNDEIVDNCVSCLF